MYKEIDANRQRTFLLIFFFLIFLIGFGWILSYSLDAPWILPLAVVVAVIQAWLAYYHSDLIALRASGAVLLPEEGDEGRRVHRAVENAAIAAGLPKPRVYFIDDTAPNAFATGRDPDHAAIAVTRGLVEKLDKRQLEGALAHEMSHIGNHDIRVMSLVVVLVGVVVLMSDWFLRISFYGGRSRNRDSAGGLVAIIAIVLAILSPIFAVLIQLAVSRKREFLADATGALITRDPDGLASALRVIGADREPLEVANRATAHLYIANPFKALDGNLGSRSWFAGLFDTHPPIEQRVTRLQSMTH